MSIIEVKSLTFAYDGGDKIFDNVSFRLDTDWRLGLTGRNGRGKTTLMRLLLGELEYSGKIRSDAKFSYFPYRVENPKLPAVDALKTPLQGHESWELYREANLLGIDPDALERPFETLSMGERTKLMLCALFLQDESERFTLIDEPTNHLDAEARRLTARYLASKKGFILISHDRAFLDACTDHTMAINRTSIDIYSGNFSVWSENKRLRDEYEAAENTRLRSEIKRLEQAAAEKAAWSDAAERSKIGFDPSKTEKSLNRRAYEGTKSKKLMSRSKAIEKRTSAMIEEKRSLLRDVETCEKLSVSPLEFRGERMIELDKASIYRGGRELISDLSLTIRKGDRISVEGKNGSGKSTLLKLIASAAGAIDADDSISLSGSLYAAQGLAVSYLSQSQEGLRGELREFAAGIDTTLFFTILRKLDFEREAFDRPLETLSAGQKKKAALARSLACRAHLYIWDEPLNYIDVISREQIEELIRDSSPTIIFAEHDHAFDEGVATKRIFL